MSFLQKRRRRAGNGELRKNKKKGPHCACMSVSAAPLATSSTSTLGCWPICEHPEPTVCLRVDQVPIESNWFWLAFVFPSYRRIHSGKLENSNCPLVRTSTTQRRLCGTDLYQPLKLFLGLICSWGVKLEGGVSANQMFLLSLALTRRCWLVAETCSANECIGCFHTAPAFCFCFAVTYIFKRRPSATFLHNLSCGPKCDQQGLKGVMFPGLDTGAIALFKSAQNKLLQSGQEGNRSWVQPTLTALSSTTRYKNSFGPFRHRLFLQFNGVLLIQL